MTFLNTLFTCNCIIFLCRATLSICFYVAKSSVWWKNWYISWKIGFFKHFASLDTKYRASYDVLEAKCRIEEMRLRKSCVADYVTFLNALFTYSSTKWMIADMLVLLNTWCTHAHPTQCHDLQNKAFCLFLSCLMQTTAKWTKL